MDFPVPQFIDVEEKIIGPMTFKQVLYLVSAGGVLFVLYFFIEFWLFIIIGVLVFGTACAFAFIKIGGRTLGRFLTCVLAYAFMPRFFVWKKIERKEAPEKIQLTKLAPEKTEEETEISLKTKRGLQAISRKVDLGMGPKHPSKEPNQTPEI